MENKNDQVIFVKDLVFAILYKWRLVVAAALVFALLLGGFGAFRFWTAASAEKATENAVSAEIEREALEKALEEAQTLVESQEEYNRNSTIMHIDPYNIFKATVQLTVLTNDNILHEAADTTSAVLQAYAAHLNSDKVINAIAQKMNMESKYLSELITISNSGNTTKSLNISVIYPDKTGAETILNMLKTEVDNANADITAKMGEHSYSCATSIDERVDLSIIDRQNDAIKRQENLLLSLANAEKELEALGSPISIKEIVILAVIGAILGAGMAAAWACFKHIVCNKVYSARVLKNRTDLRILGCVPADNKKNPIDKWLRKLEGRSQGEEQLAVAAATVKNYCADAKTVLITGDCAQADMTPLAEALKNLGVNATVGGSLLRDPAALEKLPGCDCVLLIEKCGCSEYANILLSAERIADQNKPLLGCVLLEG